MLRQGAEDDLRGLGARALAGLVDATRELNATGDLQRTLDVVLEQALRLLEADEGSVMRRTEDGGSLVIGAARGLAPHVVAETRVLLGAGIAGYVAASGTPLVLGDDREVSRYGDEEGTRHLVSSICVPLRAAGDVVGVLNVNLVRDRARRPAFDDTDLRIAVAFAEVAASALRQAQLYAAARTRADDLALLFEAGTALVGAARLDQVATALLDAARALIGAEHGFVVAAPPGRDPEPVEVRGLTLGRVLAIVRRPSVLATLLQGSGLRVVDDVATDPALATLAAGEGTTRAVVLPLHGPTGPLGLLVAVQPGGVPRPPGHRIRVLATFETPASLALARSVLAEELVAKDDELSALAIAVPDPILIVDATGGLVAINPVASELFGLNPTFETGRDVRGKLRSVELEALLLDRKDAVRTELTLLTPDPRTFRVRASSTAAGPAGSRILILEDVTTETELDRLKSDFVAVIGHELRTPLTTVRGYAKVLHSRGDDLPDAARRTAIAAIAEQSGRLEWLVEDLLLVSQVERHRPPLHLEERSFGATIAELVARAREVHPGREILLREAAGERTFPLDPLKLERVVLHLLDNAAKFAPDGPIEVVVDLDPTPRVRVTDHGPGIFSGDLPRVFDRFHQVDGSGTREHGGTGIGLHICKTLVEVWGGEIGAESDLGHGSTFWFTVPTTPPAAEPTDLVELDEG
ncbi:MAG: ATP-binding protein [Actinomycetes bacterium]